MTHQRLQAELVDAESRHGGREAVPHDVRGEVAQAEARTPDLHDARRQPAVAAADERVVGTLAGREPLDAGPQGLGDRLVRIGNSVCPAVAEAIVRANLGREAAVA